MSEQAQRFAYLPPLSASLGALAARPHTLVGGCILILAALGWTVLALIAAHGGAVGAGLAICSPGGALDGSSAALVVPMWLAMVLAMMLPSAAPMVLAYADIAECAARKREPVVSPLVFAAGYASVWIAFALFAAFAQIALAHWRFPATAVATSLSAGAVLIAAGLYQFSALKHACLRQCRRPFAFFFTRWATTPRGVFRLGTEQGAYCVGCCWALMLAMFAVGAMNVIWMAGFGMVMAAEKLGTGKWLTRAVGAALMAAGAAFVVVGLTPDVIGAG